MADGLLELSLEGRRCERCHNAAERWGRHAVPLCWLHYLEDDFAEARLDLCKARGELEGERTARRRERGRMLTAMIVAEVAALAFVCVAAAFYVSARRERRRAACDLAEAQARANFAEASERLAQGSEARANAALEEARRIENNLLRPRLVINLETGNWRALLSDEDPAANEVLGTPPSERCKKCYGRGYTGTDRTSGRLLLCGCVRVRQ